MHLAALVHAKLYYLYIRTKGTIVNALKGPLCFSHYS